MKESEQQKKSRVKKIIARLRKAYPEAKTALHFASPFQLLVATMLSAQCTDKRVNEVTPGLFKKYRSAKDFASVDPKTLEKEIYTTGFYQNKARNIIASAKTLVENFGGEIPGTLDELVQLPGVGRKTANVVLGNAFGIPALPVDTHMIRLNQRLGLTQNKDAVKIEFDLMPAIPKKDWTNYSHLIIFHGRARCPARKPDCAHCEIQDLCPSAGKV